ncbi:MAG: TetR family transcriptional regulator [Devosia sp.]|nr:TetR family transcriptional regulator [Devosia sp.]
MQISPWDKRNARDRERLLKRDAVLQVAVRSFNEKGFNATSLDDVAESLNVTKPTLYRYFSSKDEILFECVRLGLEGLQNAAASVERRGGDGMERLKALIRDYAMLMTQDFGMCITRTSDHELSPESRMKFRSMKREVDATIREVIEDGIRDGSIAAGDVRMMAFTVTGALNWIARWYEPGRELSPEQIAERCLATLVGGLAPRSGAEG